MNTLDLKPGQRPKIIVPIACLSTAQALAVAEQIGRSRADMAELRVDMLQDLAVTDLLDAIAEPLAGKPLLFTFRTAAEGGAEISQQRYLELIELAAWHPSVAAVDIEQDFPAAAEAFEIAKQAGTPIIASFHDFSATPTSEKMLSRLREMIDAGAAVAKIAVTANSLNDVARLLGVSARCGFPVIAISMGEAGAISRISGQIFGSVATFATLSGSSAPGQLSLEETIAGLDCFDV